MELANGTPFAAERFVEVDKDAAEQLIVVAKGTWTLGEDGRPAIADEQPPPSPLDEFHGEPDASIIIVKQPASHTSVAHERSKVTDRKWQAHLNRTPNRQMYR